ARRRRGERGSCTRPQGSPSPDRMARRVLKPRAAGSPWPEEVTVSWLEPFRDSVVLVTGASSGIGRATALAFAHAGARVAVAARRKELLDELSAQAGRDLLVLPTDVTRRDEVAACIDAVHQRCGRLDLVVNNAGVLIPGRLDEITASDLDAMLRVNLFGQLFVMQEALRVMGPRGDGVIVN